MKIFEIILVESDSEWKFMLELSGEWIGNIEARIERAIKLYDIEPTMKNYKDLQDIIETSKASIIETINSPVLATSRHKVAKRISNKYQEYYYRLLSIKF
jgi:hypothetical protein